MQRLDWIGYRGRGLTGIGVFVCELEHESGEDHTGIIVVPQGCIA